MTTQFAAASATGAADQAARTLANGVRGELGDQAPKLLFLFASTGQPLAELAPLVAREFPKARLIGCSTAGEVTHAGATHDSATLGAIAGDIEATAAIGDGLRGNLERAIKGAIGKLEPAPEGYRHRTA